MKRNKSFSNDQNTLYLIASPIGNLSEMTPRAIDILTYADIVGAEDTRNTSLLLNQFKLTKKLFSLREHNEIEASQKLIEMIKEGKKVAYLSDAGYPGISDPGFLLVKECIKNNIPVSVINGSSAFLSGLIPSGLATKHFYFYGFLSAKDSECRNELKSLQNIKDTLIFYESPHRINRTLKLLLDILGNREACIARELTKINEEFIRGTLEELTDIDETTLKGEMVVIIKGNDKESEIDEKTIKNYSKILLSKGLSKKDCIETISILLNIDKNKIKKIIGY